MLFGTQKVILHPNKPPTLLLLYAITNENIVKSMQVDGLLSASKTSAETSSNNSVRHTLLSLIDLGIYCHFLLGQLSTTCSNSTEVAQ